MCGKNEHKHIWENARVEGDNLQHCHFSSHRPGGRKSLGAGGRFLPAGEMKEKRGRRCIRRPIPARLWWTEGGALVRAQWRYGIMR